MSVPPTEEIDATSPLSADTSSSIARKITRVKKPVKDFGAVIPNAKKALRGALSKERIPELSDDGLRSLVTKEMVWATPDWEAMVRDGGYTQKAAAMARMLYLALPSKPNEAWLNLPESEQRAVAAIYIDVISAGREVVAGGKTPEELSAGLRNSQAARDHLGVIDEVKVDPALERYNVARWGRIGGDMSKPFYREAPALKHSEVFKAVYGGGYRNDSDLKYCLRKFANEELDDPTKNILAKNPAWPGKGKSKTQQWLEEMDVSAEETPEGWLIASRGRIVVPGANSYGDRLVAIHKDFGPLLGKAFKTQAEITDALEQVSASASVDATAQRRERLREEHERVFGKLPDETIHPEFFKRIGEDYRAGRDVTGELFIQDFGLRGGQFGNNVNNLGRQYRQEKAYDSFCDIARVLGWDFRNMSLGGQLAVAWGARGSGPAAGHYEPIDNVFNLTKEAGNHGVMGHEFGHGLDCYLGKRAKELGIFARVVSSNHAAYLSNITLTGSDGTEPPDGEAAVLRELHAAMISLSVNDGPQTKEEVVATAESAAASGKTNLNTAITNARRYLLGHSTDPVALEQFNTLQSLVKNPEPGKEQESITKGVEGLRALASGRYLPRDADINFWHSRFSTATAEHAAKLALPEDWNSPTIRPRDTNILKACKALDKHYGKKKGGYYATPVEIFARTFECVLNDSLENEGKQNAFLVIGTHGEAHPTGNERKRLVATLRPLITQVAQFMPMPKATVSTTVSSQATSAQEAGPDSSLALETTPLPTPPAVKDDVSEVLDPARPRPVTHPTSPIQVDLSLG